MKKLLALMVFSGSLLFASVNLQTASKEELMSIKGVGEKKAEQIIEYRKTNKISSPEDLKNIKGFGNNIVSNIKEDKKETLEKSTKKDKTEKVEKKEKKLENKAQEELMKK